MMSSTTALTPSVLKTDLYMLDMWVRTGPHMHLENNWVHTQTRGLTEEFNKADVAVGLVILLLEGAFVKLL